MSSWLRDDEKSLLTLAARAILEQVVRQKTPREFWESHPGKREFIYDHIYTTEAETYFLKIKDPKSPCSSWEELYRVDTAEAHERAGDQVFRYLRYLDDIYARREAAL